MVKHKDTDLLEKMVVDFMKECFKTIYSMEVENKLGLMVLVIRVTMYKE